MEFLKSKIILSFVTTLGKKRFVVVDHGKTVAEALRQYLKEIGKSHLEKSDKIGFASNGIPLTFSNNDKVEKYFNQKELKILVIDTYNLLGIIKENIQIDFDYGSKSTIFCEKDEKMKIIFNKFIEETKIKNYDSIYFLYDGQTIKEDLQLGQIISKDDLERNIIVIVVIISFKEVEELPEKESNIEINNIEDNDPSYITVYFYYKEMNLKCKCNIDEKMEDIKNKCFSKKVEDVNNLYFIYNDKKIDLNLKLKQIINEKDKNITILVHEKKMKIKIIINYLFLIQLKIKLK